MSERRPDPEALARQLDQALPPGRQFIPPITADPLVNTAAELARSPMPTLSAKSSQRIEARMLAAFDAQNAPRLLKRSRRPTEPAFRWALVASLMLVFLVVGLTPAVAASLPGEPLYSVKQLYEKLELAAATTPATQASVYLQHADRRAQEALVLLERKQFEPALIAEALSDIGFVSKLENDVRASARLRGQLLQVETTLNFIVHDAEQSGLAAQQELAPLSRLLQQIGGSDLLLPPKTATPDPTPSPTRTDEPTVQATVSPQPTNTPTTFPTNTDAPTAIATETPPPTQTPPGAEPTPTCPARGNSCNSQGVPGGQVNPPTPPGNSNGNGAGNSNAGGNGSGNGAGNSNAGGNGNGNGAGNSNAGGNGNGNGAESSNAGGNGNGNGAENSNAGGNGNGNGGGRP